MGSGKLMDVYPVLNYFGLKLTHISSVQNALGIIIYIMLDIERGGIGVRITWLNISLLNGRESQTSDGHPFISFI